MATARKGSARSKSAAPTPMGRATTPTTGRKGNGKSRPNPRRKGR